METETTTSSEFPSVEKATVKENTSVRKNKSKKTRLCESQQGFQGGKLISG